MGNRPDCAYFLLLGLCGATFLLAIGGILTYSLTLNNNGLDDETTHHRHYSLLVTSTTLRNEINEVRLQQDSSSTRKSQFRQSQTPLDSRNNGSNSEISDEDTLGGHLLLPQSHNKTTEQSEQNSSSEDETFQRPGLVLELIGPLCLFLGTVFIVILAVLAFKYPCDHEPEPEIAFLRLKSELSLNLDPEKNNYELLRRAPLPQNSSCLPSSSSSRFTETC